MSINKGNLIPIQSSLPWLRSIMIAGIIVCGLIPSERSWGQLVELVGPYSIDSVIALDQSATSASSTVSSSPGTQEGSASASDKLQVPEANPSANATSVAPATELSLPLAPQSEPTVVVLPLGAREIGCQAAQRWKPAIGLKQRAQTIQRLYCDQKQSKREAANGLAQFLCLQAYHQEDLAAANAMRAYYSRIGIAEQKKFIASGQQAVSDQQAKQNQLIDRGLAAGVDLSSLERQTFDLQDQLLQAESQDEQLRRLLCGLTGIDYAVEQKILEPLVVEHRTLDCDALVALALRERYDLQSWRCLYRQINEESAAMLASVIATSVGSFGIPLPKLAGLKQLLCSSYDKELLAQNLRREVATIIATNESYAQQLVVEKCSQLQLAYQRHQLQLQRIASWEYRLRQIERLESHGETRPADRATAEAGLLKSQSDEAIRRLDAKLAEVSLAEVVGGLAGKCCRGEAWLP